MPPRSNSSAAPALTIAHDEGSSGPVLGPFVGILGGMGPAATVDLMDKIVRLSGATRDQDHVPVVAHNVAQIPDRQVFLAGAGPSPLPTLFAALDRLNAAGAGLIVMPCNTAHIWFDELSARSRAPFIHIADAAEEALAARKLVAARLGLIATPATVAAGFYQRRLAVHGHTCLVNSAEEMDEFFSPGCYAVKSGAIERGGQLFVRAAEALAQRGATHFLLACTEVPIGLGAVDFPGLDQSIDATEALAASAIRWWHTVQASPAVARA